MTRRDYVLIAAAMRHALESAGPLAGRAFTIAHRITVGHLADALERENPNFDRARFLEACGCAS